MRACAAPPPAFPEVLPGRRPETRQSATDQRRVLISVSRPLRLQRVPVRRVSRVPAQRLHGALVRASSQPPVPHRATPAEWRRRRRRTTTARWTLRARRPARPSRRRPACGTATATTTPPISTGSSPSARWPSRPRDWTARSSSSTPVSRACYRRPPGRLRGERQRAVRQSGRRERGSGEECVAFLLFRSTAPGRGGNVKERPIRDATLLTSGGVSSRAPSPIRSIRSVSLRRVEMDVVHRRRNGRRESFLSAEKERADR